MLHFFILHPLLDRAERSAMKRIILAGTHSGCGKTTVTCAVLQALLNRGLSIGAFKCGPDYIDPMFHREILGTSGANLDLFFCPPERVCALLEEKSKGRDLAVIEGVMGYYDGMGMTTPRAGTWDMARATKSPAVLVIDAKGAALSALAVLDGFLHFEKDSCIRGVIFNRVTAMSYKPLAEEILRRYGGAVRPLGFLPALPACTLGSRHLGLITAAEVNDLREKMQLLAAQAEKTLDLDGLMDLAGEAPALDAPPVLFPKKEPVRIAAARDKAFCFYYEENLSALEAMGAEIVPFSPLADGALPEGVHGLLLGGGYPELYAQTLSQNESMRTSICASVCAGLPTLAECGGFMYLTEAIGEWPMAGALAGRCFDNGKLTRFGYVHLTAKKDGLLAKAGDSFPAHEFHRWDCTLPGADFSAEKPSGRRWDAAVSTPTLYAGFPHLHAWGCPDAFLRFYDACIKEKHRHD